LALTLPPFAVVLPPWLAPPFAVEPPLPWLPPLSLFEHATSALAAQIAAKQEMKRCILVEVPQPKSAVTKAPPLLRQRVKHCSRGAY
jgi:hypothetical protein